MSSTGPDETDHADDVRPPEGEATPTERLAPIVDDDVADEPEGPERPEGRGGADDLGERRSRRTVRRLVLLTLVVLGGLYLAGYAFASDRLPRGTEVAGVDVGGKRAPAARAALARALDPRLDDPVRVVVEERPFAIDPERAGLEVDIPGSIAQVPVGRSWNPADMWEQVVGGESYDPVVLTVDDLLEQRLQQIAASMEEPVVEGDVRFTAEGAEPVEPAAGRALDLSDAADRVLASYPFAGSPVELALTETEPDIDASDVSRAMRRFADPAMSAPVVYEIGTEKVVLRPADYAPALSVEPVDGRLEPRVDGKALLRAFTPAARTLSDAPQDATVRIVDGRPRVIPARKGVTLDREAIVDRFLDVVTEEGEGRTVRLPTELAEPEVSTEEVRALGVREVVSEFTTYYPHADYRNVNIGRAAQIIDGTLLKPGETFSLNGIVGERTAANGFTKGFIISDGVFKEDYGGGVSQVATTTFNAAFFAGLEDVEHQPHSFYIDRYPVGREATVVWPVVDLRFANDTDYGVLIDTSLTPSTPSTSGALTVRMWSTKVWDISATDSGRYALTPPETRRIKGDDCYPNEGYDGFQIDVTRIFRRVGESEVVRTERMHTVYTPADTVICVD